MHTINAAHIVVMSKRKCGLTFKLAKVMHNDGSRTAVLLHGEFISSNLKA